MKYLIVIAALCLGCHPHEAPVAGCHVGEFRCNGQRSELCSPRTAWIPNGNMVCLSGQTCVMGDAGTTGCAPVRDGGFE